MDQLKLFNKSALGFCFQFRFGQNLGLPMDSYMSDCPVVTMDEVYSRRGLQELKRKADSFRDGEGIKMIKIETFYRNKPSSYFQEIKEKYNNIMYPYRKDDNGDEYCPANGRIRGLFFMGRRDKKYPSMLPTYYMFGDKRVIVPAEMILGPRHKLYFCDFWCHRNEHYTTIVVARPGTEAYRFCQTYLLSLNKHNNGYLERNFNDEVSINQNIWVEVLFTEELDLNTEGITSIIGSQRHLSKLNGMEKRSNCRTCNITGADTIEIDEPLIEEEFSCNRVPIRPEFRTPTPPPTVITIQSETEESETEEPDNVLPVSTAIGLAGPSAEYKAPIESLSDESVPVFGTSTLGDTVKKSDISEEITGDKEVTESNVAEHTDTVKEEPVISEEITKQDTENDVAENIETKPMPKKRRLDEFQSDTDESDGEPVPKKSSLEDDV